MPYSKNYYQANKEKRNAISKAYYEANKEKLLSKSNAYYKTNKEKIKAHREANKKEVNAKRKVYYKTNREKILAYRKDNKEKILSIRLKCKYNITLKEKNIMLKKQKNKCKICNIKFSKTRSCVDHCHTTNKVRGILCNLCNVGLGYFKDNTKSLTNAITYLEEAETLPEEFKKIEQQPKNPDGTRKGWYK